MFGTVETITIRWIVLSCFHTASPRLYDNIAEWIDLLDICIAHYCLWWTTVINSLKGNVAMHWTFFKQCVDNRRTSALCSRRSVPGHQDLGSDSYYWTQHGDTAQRCILRFGLVWSRGCWDMGHEPPGCGLAVWIQSYQWGKILT